MPKTMKNKDKAKQSEIDKKWAILQRAQQGDETVLDQVREILKNPQFVEQCGGDLSLVLENSIIEKLSGENHLVHEALKKKLPMLREQLAGPNPSPVEQLLIDRVVTCWLHLHHAEILYFQNNNSTFNQARFQQDRIDRAHKRFISAVKALATVRKLALNVLIGQVNVAGQQVNVSSQ